MSRSNADFHSSSFSHSPTDVAADDCQRAKHEHHGNSKTRKICRWTADIERKISSIGSQHITDAPDSDRRTNTGAPDFCWIDIRSERVHCSLHCVERSSKKDEHQDEKRTARIQWSRCNNQRACDGDTGYAEHGSTRTEPLDEQRAEDPPHDASNIPPAQCITCSRLRESRSRQRRDQQQDTDVVRQQTEKERAEETQRVAAEFRHEKIGHHYLRFRAIALTLRGARFGIR